MWILQDFWYLLIGIVSMRLRSGYGLKKKDFLYLKFSPTSYASFQYLFPLPSRRTLHSLLNTVQFRMGMNTHVLVQSRTTYRQCLIKFAWFVSCLTGCQSEDWLYWRLWGHWMPWQDNQYCISWPGLYASWSMYKAEASNGFLFDSREH